MLAFLDADDSWGPDHLAIHLDILRRTECAVAFGRAKFTDMQGIATGKMASTRKGEVSAREALAGNPCTTCSTMLIQREAYIAVGPFLEGLNHAEDQEWILRALLKGHKLVCSGVASTNYRTSCHGQSADLASMYEGFKAVIETAEKLAPSFTRSHRQEAEARIMLYLARRAIRLGQGRRTAWRYLAPALLQSRHLLSSAPSQLAAALVAFFIPTDVFLLCTSRARTKPVSWS